MHKDPEFDQVKDLVTLKTLPYKKKGTAMVMGYLKSRILFPG